MIKISWIAEALEGNWCLVIRIGVIRFVRGAPSASLRVTYHPLCHSEHSEESRLLRLLVRPGTGPGFTLTKSRDCLATGEYRGAKPLCRGLGGAPIFDSPPRLGNYRGLKELVNDHFSPLLADVPAMSIVL